MGTHKDAGSKKKPIAATPQKFVAPDGGWGWVVVFASAMSNVIVIPIMQSFGLVFKDKFIDLGMTATDCSIIINVNSAFGMGLGLINGALLRRFTFRKVAVCGSLLVFCGVFGLTWANTFAEFLVLYGLVTSIGTILVLSSFSLALNTYFKVRRGRAAGLSLTATGLGPIVMPLVISMLLDYYGVQGTVLILSGLSLHSFMAALLLHPVTWHLNPVVEASPAAEIETNDVTYEANDEDQEARKPRRRYRSITSNSIDLDIDTKSMYGFETPMIEKRNVSADYQKGRPIRVVRSISQIHEGRQGVSRLREPSDNHSSMETIHLGSSLQIFEHRTYVAIPNGDGPEKEPTKRDGKKDARIKFHENVQSTQLESKESGNSESDLESNGSSEIDESDESCMKGMGRRLVVFFDLDLLSDRHYVSLMLGMSIAACAEINFSLFTPFIMADMGFETSQVAAIMSTIALADIVFRFLAPYIGDALKWPAQVMYILGLVMLIISRTTLIFFNTFHTVLAVGVMLGVAKGFRTVYMTLVIPAYVPLDRLAAASGLQMVTNGIFIMCFGPIMGIIRDWTGSYNKSILALNGLTLFTVCMWTIELLVLRYKKRKAQPVSIGSNDNNIHGRHL